MIGFYSYIRAINNCTRETLEIGAEYAKKFREGSVDIDTYRAEMFDKIHGVALKNAFGNSELYDTLDSDFVKPAYKYLEKTLEAYTDSED